MVETVLQALLMFNKYRAMLKYMTKEPKASVQRGYKSVLRL